MGLINTYYKVTIDGQDEVLKFRTQQEIADYFGCALAYINMVYKGRYNMGPLSKLHIEKIQELKNIND